MNNSLKNKILITISFLLLYRFGTFIPIPGINYEMIESFFKSDKANFLGMINLFSGGALQRMSIFALNIMPYITSSIIMQLVSSLYKGFQNLKKEGEYGRVKINQYTRYLTIILAIFQSFGVYFAISKIEGGGYIDDSSIFMITTVVSLVGGTVMLMWFGERITSTGIGNGISLIIFVGIISSLPSSIIQIFNLSKNGTYSWFFILVFLGSFVGIVAFICFVEKILRLIKIQYPNVAMIRSKGMSDNTSLPLKLNISGVIPPIFASSILTFPNAIFQYIGYDNSWYLALFNKSSILYILLFSSLIVFFCFFYSSIVFNTEELAQNLKKNNCFIIGIRPGANTTKYLDEIIVRLTTLGSIYLVFICTIPEYFVAKFSIPFYVGGTGILIIVNVIMDLMTQYQSHSISSYYNSNNRKRRIKIRR